MLAGESRKSVCVLGAGVGGLTAAAYLAKSGYKVTVIEKAVTIGGSAGWYIRKKRRFPTGATIAFGLEEQGLLRSLLDELEIELSAEKLTHPMDVILSDRKVSVYLDQDLWQQELQQAFSPKSSQTLQFWQELTKISAAVSGVTATRVALPIRRPVDLGKLPQYALQHPSAMLRLARYAFWTVGDLLRKYKLDDYEPLCQFLNAQLLDAVQIDLEQAALLPASLALTIYRQGSFAFPKGIGQLGQSLADKVTSLGGEVLLSSAVKQVSYLNDRKKWHIESRKCTADFDVVINNTGVPFGEGTSHVDDQAFSWGAYRLDAILNVAVWQEELQGKKLPFAYQLMPSQEQEDPALKMDELHGPIYLTFNHALDQNGHAVDEEITMTVSVHTDLGVWRTYSKDVYAYKKQQLTAAVLAQIERVFPVRKYILSSEAGTPLTYEKYIGKMSVGGYPLTVHHAILKPKSVRSKWPQLYIVGEQSFPGPGTLSSALSGYYAARAIKSSHRGSGK